ncbi:protein kinase [Histoplasma capsulatum G186AR]|uniref:Protein kinase n=1 Tax=Ajellomyces capsulatus TaxID=5037 RepID=A0A8H8D3R7_AJECA|nr:protein kinase [Histoplasma capsulatum]QSS67595.1 protein kinase [Histoplasma capsulatum G186AR]
MREQKQSLDQQEVVWWAFPVDMLHNAPSTTSKMDVSAMSFTRGGPVATRTAMMSQYPEDSNTVDLGHFAKTDREEEDDVDELAEPCEKYNIRETPHVFCPVRIGEVLNQRLSYRP